MLRTAVARDLPAALLATLLAGCCLPAPAPSPDAPTPPPPPATPPAPSSGGTSASSGAPPPPGPFLSRLPETTSRSDSHLEARARANRIPQSEDLREEFASLVDGPAGDVTGGRLLCDLQMPATPWFRSRPDMRARFTLAGGATMVADGRDNRDNVTLAVPVDRLTAGDALRIEVHDRDLFNNDDFLDAIDTPFPGHFPLIKQGGARKLTVTCRHQSADVVAPRFADARRVSAERLDQWRTSLADALHPARPDLGYPWDRHEAMEEAIDGMAALVGWEEPAVVAARQDRLAGVSAWETRAATLVKTLLAKAHAGKDALAIRGLGSVGPISVTCGEQGVRALLAGTPVAGEASPPCVVQTVTSVDMADPATMGTWEVALVLPEGRTERLILLTTKPGSAIWQTAALGGALGSSPIKTAVMLRVSDGRTAELWRL